MDKLPQPTRVPFDTSTYARQSQEGPCFICAILDGHPDYSHHRVYEDDDTIAFLNRHPTLLGHCLVAPKRHVESWLDDLDDEQFLALQHVVRHVARAVVAVVPTERMYSLSLGSQQGNAHLHWHIAPLPPGVPYHQQQYYASWRKTASWTSTTTPRQPSPGRSRTICDLSRPSDCVACR